MNKLAYAFGIIMFLIVFMTCTMKDTSSIKNIKDLDENMIDIRLYHELVGDELKAGDMEDARWFLTGMDSILQIVSEKYDTHRKLDKPFRDSYEKNLKPSIEELQKSFDQNNLVLSKQAYTTLTKKCNGCHKDNDIDKEVQNWLFRGENAY